MYQDHIHIVTSGLSPELNAAIQACPALPACEHAFAVVDDIDSSGEVNPLLSQADLVIVACPEHDALSKVHQVLSCIGARAQVIVLVDSANAAGIACLADERIFDIATLPVSPEMLAFRFSRWQHHRKQADDLFEAQQFLDATINSIPCLVWYKTDAGVHEKVNDAFCKTVNKPKEIVEGKRHAFIWDVEQDDPACIESERIVMSNQKTCIAEEQVQTGDGKRLLTTYKSPLYNLDGSVMGTVGVAIDITQEREYENSLIEKNRSLESIFRSMDGGIIAHSLDGKQILSINEAALSILECGSLEELMESGFDMVAPSLFEEDKRVVRARINSLKSPGDSASIDYRIRRDDGSVTHIMGNVKLMEQDGELFYQRFLIDVTEQKLREEEKERHQRDLINALSRDYLLVCSFDMDTGEGETLRITKDGEGAELKEIFPEKVKLESCLRTYIEQRVYEKDREMLVAALSRESISLEMAQNKRFDTTYRTGCDGSLEYHQATVVRVRDWNSDHLVVLGLRNVDSQIREEMQKTTLLEEALMRANKASEAKSAFLTNMSHDIRTPMNAIMGFTTLASNHVTETERVRDYLAKIRTSSAHLLSLINDILDMSRIESGKASLDEKPCNIAEVFDNLAVILQSEVARNGLTLTVDTSHITHPEVYCDSLKINQIMLNLLGNAIKFTDADGFVSVRVDELPDAPVDHARFRVVVTDTGIGMSESFLEHIFDPFERERTSTISGIQGTGLGMAITKNLVDMMNGTIDVRSTLGQGSEFTLVFTLQRTSKESLADAFCPTDTSANAADKMRGARVLLVDDNMLNREIAITILQDAGFVVDYATNGQEAVDMVRNAAPGCYKLVLMDIQMPIMNGYEAARAIRDYEQETQACDAGRMCILAITADAFDTDRNKALACGMDGHVPKPIEIDVLFDALNKLLVG
ncbi:ATP-binding protein [Eggerthellaceae bacterium 3-80]|nr:response regulator [bacterium D16-34]